MKVRTFEQVKRVRSGEKVRSERKANSWNRDERIKEEVKMIFREANMWKRCFKR